MKKIVALAFLGLTLTLLIAGCGTKKNCEAYDGKQSSLNQVESTRTPS